VRLFGGLRHSWAGGGNQFWSPSAGVTWRWFRAAAYRSFRAPTLNELYRQFRVGNVLTLANADLRPETLWGVEAGFTWHDEKTQVAVTAFRNSLTNLISNVTLSVTPQLITRRRENAADALAQGIEANLQRRLGPIQLQLAYLFVDARYVTGPRIPQTPRNSGTAQLGWVHRGTSLWGGLRVTGLAYEDDLNLFPLPGFPFWFFTASQALPHHLTAFLSFENVFNRIYAVGYSPTPLIGMPRLGRIGLSWNF